MQTSLMYAKETPLDGEHPRIVKCGRDCAYTVCKLLGVDIAIHQLDAEMGHQPTTTMEDLRLILTRRRLHCRAFAIGAKDVQRVSEALLSGEVVAIVFLTPRSETMAGHFVLMSAMRSGGVEFVDVSRDLQYAV